MLIVADSIIAAAGERTTFLDAVQPMVTATLALSIASADIKNSVISEVGTMP